MSQRSPFLLLPSRSISIVLCLNHLNITGKCLRDRLHVVVPPYLGVAFFVFFFRDDLSMSKDLPDTWYVGCFYTWVHVYLCRSCNAIIIMAGVQMQLWPPWNTVRSGHFCIKLCNRVRGYAKTVRRTCTWLYMYVRVSERACTWTYVYAAWFSRILWLQRIPYGRTFPMSLKEHVALDRTSWSFKSSWNRLLWNTWG